MKYVWLVCLSDTSIDNSCRFYPENVFDSEDKAKARIEYLNRDEDNTTSLQWVIIKKVVQ